MGWELIERSTCGLHDRPVFVLTCISGVLIVMFFCDMCSHAFICLVLRVDGFQLPIPAFFYIQGFSSCVGWVLNPSSKLSWSSAQFYLKEPAGINQGDTWGQYLTDRVSFWREPVSWLRTSFYWEPSLNELRVNYINNPVYGSQAVYRFLGSSLGLG
jgi:hypothetical protein